MIFGGKSRRVDEHRAALRDAERLVKKYNINKPSERPLFDVSGVPREFREYLYDQLENLHAHLDMTPDDELGDRGVLAELKEAAHCAGVVDAASYTSIARAAARAQLLRSDLLGCGGGA